MWARTDKLFLSRVPAFNGVKESQKMSNSAEKHSVRRLSIRVTAESNPGGRRYMEDYMTFQMTCNLPQPRYPQLGEQVFMGIFDGHGGKEAAKHTRDRLWEVLQDQPKFLGTDIKSIKESLSDAYLAVHKEMEPLRGKLSLSLPNIRGGIF